MKRKLHAVFLTTLTALAVSSCTQHDEQPPVADQADENSGPGTYEYHLARANEAAQGIAANLLRLCELPTPPGDRPAYKLPSAEDFTAGRVFDNLYYVGSENLSSWAVNTSDGLIIIDALNNDREAEGIIAANLLKLGLDPNEVKHILISHGHGDHYGGARYLQDLSGASVWASEADWNLMNGDDRLMVAHWSDPPAQDLTVVDGEQISLGNSSVTPYLTPGHTPGTISTLIPVTDKGESHVAILWGGTGFNFEQVAENFDMYADSARRLREVAETAGADVLLSNHGFVDGTPEKLPALLKRRAGESNPYVVGKQSVQNFLTVAEECALARKSLL